MPDDRGRMPRAGSSHSAPILRRQAASETAAPDGCDAPFAAARLSALTHELANLLDGSMRCLGLAQRSLAGSEGRGETGQGAAAVTPELARRIETVHAALTQMAELVRSAMGGVGTDLKLGRRPGLVEGWTLEEALRHAADVMTPVAQEAGIAVTLDLWPGASETRCGSIYAPVAAGIRNAIEAIQRCGRTGGEVRISARTERSEARPTPTIVLEIADNGAGPPPLPAGEEGRVFELGFTTKGTDGRRRRATDAAAGIGLAMVRDVVASLGGTVELSARPEGGAVLRMMYPMKAECTKRPGGTERC